MAIIATENFVMNSDVDKLLKNLKRIKETAIPYATRYTVNQLAIETQAEQIQNVKRQMVTRNHWTVGSIKRELTRKRNINDMESRAGSINPYMSMQEDGGTKTVASQKAEYPDSSSSSLRMATPASTGETSQPRRKLPSGRNRMRSIKLSDRYKMTRYKGRKKQQTVALINEAYNDGQRFLMLYNPFGRRRKGIYKLVGGRKGGVHKGRKQRSLGRRGWPKGVKLHLFHDMTKSSYDIPKNEWSEKAGRKVVETRANAIVKQALLYQFKTLKI